MYHKGSSRKVPNAIAILHTLPERDDCLKDILAIKTACWPIKIVLNLRCWFEKQFRTRHFEYIKLLWRTENT
jgi:hypothetical protein